MLNFKNKKLLKAKSITNVKQFNPILKQVLVKLIFIIGRLLFFFKRNNLPDKINKVLFISLYFNGDILFQSPVFEIIRKIYPNAELHIWIKKRTEDIIKGYPYFSKVYLFEDIRTRKYNEEINNDFKLKINFFKKLRAEKYDLIFDLTGLFWTAAAVFYSKPRYSAGINFQGFGFIYNFNSKAITNGHLIDKNLNLITKNKHFSKLIENINVINKPVYHISEESRKHINLLLKKIKIGENKLNVVMHLTSGWESKRWSLNNFADLINLLSEDYNIFLIGSKEDKIIYDKFEKSIKRKVFNLAGLLTLNETSELIKRADLYVGSDSGPLYLAEAVGTRTISLFGPTNPLFSAPRGSNHKYIYHKLFCSADNDKQNCKLIAGLNCKTYDCMNMIKPIDVYNMIISIIKN